MLGAWWRTSTSSPGETLFSLRLIVPFWIVVAGDSSMLCHRVQFRRCPDAGSSLFEGVQHPLGGRLVHRLYLFEMHSVLRLNFALADHAAILLPDVEYL